MHPHVAANEQYAKLSFNSFFFFRICLPTREKYPLRSTNRPHPLPKNPPPPRTTLAPPMVKKTPWTPKSNKYPLIPHPRSLLLTIVCVLNSSSLYSCPLKVIYVVLLLLLFHTLRQRKFFEDEKKKEKNPSNHGPLQDFPPENFDFASVDQPSLLNHPSISFFVSFVDIAHAFGPAVGPTVALNCTCPW